MNLDETYRTKARFAVTLLDRIPDGVWTEFSGTHIGFQAETQEQVKAIRALFPGVIWKKSYDEYVKWWNYDGTYEGIELRIYAVRQAPPTCTAIEVTETKVEKVPTAWEEREVTRTKLVWDCGATSANAGVDE